MDFEGGALGRGRGPLGRGQGAAESAGHHQLQLGGRRVQSPELMERVAARAQKPKSWGGSRAQAPRLLALVWGRWPRATLLA